jgi:hypothetical protein
LVLAWTRRSRARAFVLGLTSALLGVAGVAALPAAASTSTATLRARAAAISAKIAADDAALNSLGAQYLADRAALTRATGAERLDAIIVRRLSGLVVKDRRAAAVAAAGAYVDSGASTDLGVYLAERPDELVTSAAYLNSALSILKTAAQDYTRAEGNWRAAFSRQQRAAAAATTALAAATNERSAVLSTLAKEQQLQASVNGQIEQLVAAQLAARLAAQRTAAAAAAQHQAVAAGPPSPAAASLASAPVPPGSLAGKFAALRNCESSGDYQDNTGNGYYGAYQFALATWLGLGETGLPSSAPPSVQDAAAYALYRQDGWVPWPACSAILGL